MRRARQLSPIALLPLAIAATATPGLAQEATAMPATHAVAPVAVLNDNRTPAGTRRGRTVAITLVLGEARWRPLGDSTLEFRVATFAEAGGPALVPGPLLRARVGDSLVVTVRNPTARELLVAGLDDRGAASPGDTLRVPAGTTRERRIRLTSAGTFWYDAITRHESDPPHPPTPVPEKPRRADLGLLGAFVVDPADAPDDAAARDRIFVVHGAFDRELLLRFAAGKARIPFARLNFNGGSWPNTERLEYAVGDTVRWRLINASPVPHPMHLHGFYFRVDGRGDFAADTAYAPAARRRGVTELLETHTTATITWVPERAGNWLFHCHLLMHMSPMKGGLAGQAPVAHAAHAASSATPAAEPHDPRDHMAGLVLGIHVRGRETRDEAIGAPRRRLALYAQSRDSALAGGVRGYGFVLAEGGQPPARDSIRRPGSPIILVRGEPVAIVVHNRLAKPLAVHWHGLELESRYDGVGGWSGRPGSVTPAIAPGDSFTVRLTPPRAGTFIYHTHDESDNELDAGLYGPLLVLEPGARRDGRRDHVLVLASGADGVQGPLSAPVRRHVPVVNGDTAPPALVLAPGRNVIRLIQIADSDVKELRLVDSAGAPLQWTVLAKDGWSHPAAGRRPRDAALAMGVGETYDVELDAAAVATRGGAWLEVLTRYYPGYRHVNVHRARMRVVAGMASAAR